MINNNRGKSKLGQTRWFLYRLRRYPHNQITKSSVMMAGDTLDRKNRKVTYLVLIVLLFSTIPMVPSASADDGLPEQFQAQEIEAILYDPEK